MASYKMHKEDISIILMTAIIQFHIIYKTVIAICI